MTPKNVQKKREGRAAEKSGIFYANNIRKQHAQTPFSQTLVSSPPPPVSPQTDVRKKKIASGRSLLPL